MSSLKELAELPSGFPAAWRSAVGSRVGNAQVQAWLELDLDEKVLALDSPTLAATLERIAATGVRLSIDDFGRGLSSIPRLRRYPLAALKLDPELVRGVGRSEDSEAIVEAVGALAGTLGLEIYARGVEHRGQQAFLCALDCHLQQGPLFGRPLAAREFAASIAAATGRGDRVRRHP